MQSPSPSPRSRALSRTVLLLPFRLAGRRAHLSAAHSVASRRAPTNSRASAAASALGLFGRERDQFDECDESGDPSAGPDFSFPLVVPHAVLVLLHLVLSLLPSLYWWWRCCCTYYYCSVGIRCARPPVRPWLWLASPPGTSTSATLLLVPGVLVTTTMMITFNYSSRRGGSRAGQGTHMR
jgi:hypothetical protein